MTCPRCNSEISEASIICPVCGDWYAASAQKERVDNLKANTKSIVHESFKSNLFLAMTILMTMIAVVEGAESAYEVAAFVDGECRGSARPIYVEALDSYIMFMTISGEDGETLTFKYYDVNTGETYAIVDEFIFSVNATVGDVMNPYVMTRGAMGVDELSSSINIYPNPVDNELFLATEVRVEEIAIYDVYGRTTTVYGLQTTDFVHSIDVADLEAGVYFVNIKTENGNVVKRFIKN